MADIASFSPHTVCEIIVKYGFSQNNKNILVKAVSFAPITVCETLLKHGFSPNDALKPSIVLTEADAIFDTRYSDGRETALHQADTP